PGSWNPTRPCTWKPVSASSPNFDTGKLGPAPNETSQARWACPSAGNIRTARTAAADLIIKFMVIDSFGFVRSPDRRFSVRSDPSSSCPWWRHRLRGSRCSPDARVGSRPYVRFLHFSHPSGRADGHLVHRAEDHVGDARRLDPDPYEDLLPDR